MLSDRLASFVSRFRSASCVATIADCQRQQIEVEETMALLKTRIAELTENVLSEGHLRGAVEAFKPAWESLALQERIRLLRLLVQEVVYDGETGEIAITFYPNGIKSIEVA